MIKGGIREVIDPSVRASGAKPARAKRAKMRAGKPLWKGGSLSSKRPVEWPAAQRREERRTLRGLVEIPSLLRGVGERREGSRSIPSPSPTPSPLAGGKLEGISNASDV